MVDPRIPHLFGIVLDSNGVANTLVIATNKATREKQRKRTDSNKIVIFDVAEFRTPYGLDVIEFMNVGSSVGVVTATVNSLTGGFQQVDMTTAAAPTVSINL